MRRYAILLLLCLPAFGQEFKIPASLEKLAAKAAETVDVTLDGALLQLAGRFLDAKKPDEAQAKEVISGLKGIMVRSFEFEKEGEYTPADVDAVRVQLRAPGWSRMVGVVSKKDGEISEVYTRVDGGKVGGLVVLVAEPKELTIVSINGSIDIDKLAALGGQFGIPDLGIERKKKD